LHINTDTPNQNLDQVQVNLIYNTNRNLFLWIKILISTTDLYSTTADRSRTTCRIGIKKAHASIGGLSLCVQVPRERSYPLQTDGRNAVPSTALAMRASRIAARCKNQSFMQPQLPY